MSIWATSADLYKAWLGLEADMDWLSLGLLGDNVSDFVDRNLMLLVQFHPRFSWFESHYPVYVYIYIILYYIIIYIYIPLYPTTSHSILVSPVIYHYMPFPYITIIAVLLVIMWVKQCHKPSPSHHHFYGCYKPSKYGVDYSCFTNTSY